MEALETTSTPVTELDWDLGEGADGVCARDAEPGRFRQVFGELPTGVTVVTTAGRAGLAGLTASSVSSVSLEPLLILVCIHNGSATLRALLRNGRFAVNVLRDTQVCLSSVFADPVPGAEKFAGFSYELVDGLPILDGVVIWVSCDLTATLPGGDHTIVLGAVTGMARMGGQPLVRQGGRYRRLGEPV